MKKQLFLGLVFSAGLSAFAGTVPVQLGATHLYKDGKISTAELTPIERDCVQLQADEVARLRPVDPEPHGSTLSITLFVESRGGLSRSEQPEQIVKVPRTPFAVELVDDHHKNASESSLTLELTRAGECIYTQSLDLQDAFENKIE